MKFKDWIKDYEKEYERELEEWKSKSKLKGIIPQGFDESLLNQYVAYKSEIRTKQLVIATWVLAAVTILLNIVTLFFSF